MTVVKDTATYLQFFFFFLVKDRFCITLFFAYGKPDDISATSSSIMWLNFIIKESEVIEWDTTNSKIDYKIYPSYVIRF